MRAPGEVAGGAAHQLAGDQLLGIDLEQRSGAGVGQRDAQRQERPLGREPPGRVALGGARARRRPAVGARRRLRVRCPAPSISVAKRASVSSSRPATRRSSSSPNALSAGRSSAGRSSLNARSRPSALRGVGALEDPLDVEVDERHRASTRSRSASAPARSISSAGSVPSGSGDNAQLEVARGRSPGRPAASRPGRRGRRRGTARAPSPRARARRSAPRSARCP